MKSAARFAGFAFAMAAFWAVPAVAQAPESKSFRDWNAACNEVLRCFAETRNVDGLPHDFLLRLARNRNEPKWNVILVTAAATPAQPFEIYADLDGSTVAFQGAEAAGAFGRASDIHLLGPNATELMRQMGPASDVGFEFLDAGGDLHAARFSLSGLSASLLWIDEKQGRLGAPREAGDLPEGLEPAEASAAAPADVPAGLLDFHAAQDACEAPEDLPNGDEIMVLRLSGDRTLYLVPCFSGAYNFAHAAYLEANGYLERYWFADYSDYASWTATGVIVNPWWDEATQTLSMFNRGRGLGDCGSTGEWKNHEGYLRLERFTAKDACDAEGEPGEFPVVFEAKPRE